MAIARVKASPPQVSFELGENMTMGDPFRVYDDSGSPKIDKCLSTVSNKSNYAKGYYNASCMTSTDVFVVVYRDLNNSNRGYIRAGKIAVNNTITWGTAVCFYSSTAYYLDVCSHTTGAFCITYKGTGNLAEIIAGTLSSTTLVITLGAAAVSLSTGTCYYNQICSPATGKVMAVYKDAGQSNRTQATAATIVGTVITAGAAIAIDTLSASYISSCSPATDKVVTTFYGSSRGYAVASTLVGTVINSGGRSEFSAAAVYSTYVKSPATDKVVVIYRNSADSYKPYARSASLVGTVFTWGTAIKILDSPSYYQAIGIFATDSIVFMVSKDDVSYKGIAIKATLSGTTITLGTSDTFIDARIYYVDCIGISATRYALVWYDTALLNSYALIVEDDVNSIPQCLGILEETGIAGETKKCAMLNSTSDSMSGLTIADRYYIQEDGSISTTLSAYPIAYAYDTDKLFITKTIME